NPPGRCRVNIFGYIPPPCAAPLPGVTLPASPECPSPQSRGWLLGCQWVVAALSACGRCRCRWCVPQECSMSWAWLLAEVEVVLLAVVVVDGVGFDGVRRCGRACWSRVSLSRALLAPPAWRYPSGFAGVSFATV